MTLPDGEFFMLNDWRDEAELLSSDYHPDLTPDSEEFLTFVTMQYDADRDRSRSLGMARFELIRQLYPDRPMTEVLPHLFDDARVRLDAGLVLGASYFKGKAPETIAHFDRLHDYACEPSVTHDGDFYGWQWPYTLVSKDWKDAIESLEPDMHQFFPHDLVFSNGTLRGYFIFRDMGIIDFVDLTNSEVGRGVYKIKRGRLAGKYSIVGGVPRGLAGKREVLQGRHWVKQEGNYFPFLSRVLAERLFPLFPKKIELIPVRLV